ncbi:MAG: serine hydroxymethyltransferase [Alphaproteobacteria bacterium]|nr:serine hydroxymethyltransferase [Alphaproteobacteria bacterium]OJV17254.1 MAG: serine hydroxymethyltransferase [Alphaproteobacteria bacterium 33-17]
MMTDERQVFELFDKEIFDSISKEYERQENHIELIASENYASKQVMLAQGSVLTNKYAEGYPGKRYYGGCEVVDIVENLAIDRVKKLFNCGFANVQPHSGSQANQAVYLALLSPGDTILGMSLNSGGHLTHGAKPNMSGKWFNAVQYEVDKETNLIDYEQVAKLAREHKPKMIIAGGSAYSRVLDFAKFREICDEVGAIFMVDMAHIAGLVATDHHPSPFPHADVVTSTTHKTLRGPRGGIVLTNSEEIAKKVNSALFPGLQGGPLMHVIAAKAVAFGEALDSGFKTYIQNVVDNAKTLADKLTTGGVDIVTGGTDNHLMLVDLRKKNVTGNIVEKSLDRAGIACNMNSIPFDLEKPTVTSGIRLGSPAATTRGFGKKEFAYTADIILEIIEALAKDKENTSAVEEKVLTQVIELCKKFPMYAQTE